ncbi:hypothetical protein [Phaeobacter piscinae]|uniref:hypothetical protein n=1 Tax=Phaeobacter piscinae TaxID=1580596 RepID=UPI00058FD494|nr:hypothetical protein [Phaeobacter piscinae]UTS81241.1 hypothetical protein OL67_002319 [Phaeobacter piscinae]
MSEPVTQAEIEDVLSSIRRLVSEDSRAAGSSVGKGAEAALAAQIAKPVPAASGEQGVGAPGPANGATNGSSQPVTRLVLTPALRVPESKLTPVAPTPSPPPAADIATSASAENDHVSEEIADVAPGSLAALSGKDRFEALLAADAIEFWDEPEDRIAQGIALHDNDPGNEDLAFFNGITAATAADEAADETQDAALAADMPGTPTAQAEGALNTEAPWTDPAATLYQAAASTDHEEETQAEDPVAPAPPTKPASQLNPKVGAVVQKLAEMEAANTARPVLWEPDGTRDTPYAGSDLETLAWDDQDSDADAQGQTEPVDQTQSVADVVIRSEGEDTQSEASQAEVPQPEVSQIEPSPRQPEQHTQAEVPAADTAVEENTRTDIPAAPAASTADEVDRDLLETSVTETALEALDTLGSDESFLDEHALRELVSEIVREELQGALGERITRNVRKLVRREIHRALSAQNLL